MIPVSHLYLSDSSLYLDGTTWTKQEFANVNAYSIKFLTMLYCWTR